jgi:hypothetical protein
MAKDSNISQTGGGVRMSSGITGKGGAKVNPVYKESVPPISQGAPKVKYSPNVTVQAPGRLGKLETHIDLHYHPKYSK